MEETKDILIKIAYKGRSTESVSYPLITSGSVDTVSVQFEFDDAWRGFVKRAIFASSNTIIQKLLNESNICEVPWEVLTHPGDVSIGVVGQNDMEIMPSVKTAIHISEGTDTTGDASKTPSSDIYDQMIQIMQQTLETATALHSAAAAGEFDGKDGTNGEDGEDGYTPKRGIDYWTDADIEYILKRFEAYFVPRSSADTAVYSRVNGEDDVIEYAAESAKPLSIVRRNGGGRIITADPITPLNAANKKYVDEKIAEIRLYLGGMV